MKRVGGVAVLAAQRTTGEAHEHRGKPHGVGLTLQRVENLRDLEAAPGFGSWCRRTRHPFPVRSSATGWQALQPIRRELRGLGARITAHHVFERDARVAVAAHVPTA